MSRLLRAACLDNPTELVELVSEAVGEIISGGVLLDTVLGNEEFGFFDLLAADGDGEGIFFFINSSGCETEYLRLLKCMRWYRENWDALHRLHAGRVALGATPPVVVVAPSYSYSMQKVLLNICGSRIILLKYLCFQDGSEKKSLFIEKVGDSFEDTEKAGSRSVFETPPALVTSDRPEISPGKTIMRLMNFRRRIGTDISNVSDEELLDLIGSPNSSD